MIDRALIGKIALAAIEAYLSCEIVDIDAAKVEAALRTVDQFTPAEIAGDEVDAEIDRINAEYLAQTARQAVLHYLREGWAKERIAWRKEREANSR